MDWVKRIRQLALLLLLVLGAVLLLVGCLDDEDEGERALVFANEYRAEDSWLVYWYVCGTDLESEMGAASSDLEELQKVQLPENVKVLIQTGGTETWQNDMVKGGVIGRYLYDKDGLHELEQAPDADMGAKDTLAAFLSYPKRRKTPDFSYGDIRRVRQIYASN